MAGLVEKEGESSKQIFLGTFIRMRNWLSFPGDFYVDGRKVFTDRRVFIFSNMLVKVSSCIVRAV